MSWENRLYAQDGNEYSPGGGGARAWLGGLPGPTKAVKWIMIANGAMFLLCLMTGGADGFLYRLLEMRTDLVLKGQLWRLFTFTYLHDQYSLSHVFFNMLGLYFLGVHVERAWGTGRFFVFYTLGGFVAVLLYLLVTLIGWLDSGVALVGASGGVLAVLGVCAVLFPAIQLILFFFPVPIRTAVLIFSVFYGFNLVTRGANAGGDACHLAGMAFGVAWGYRGHRWWNAADSIGDGLKHRATDAKRRQEMQMLASVDQILDKVRDHGIQSLTSREKTILEEASKRQQSGR